jgi:hypothetical protein
VVVVLVALAVSKIFDRTAREGPLDIRNAADSAR